MAEKYLIWPLRFFLYISSILVALFYFTIFSLSINYVSKLFIQNTIGDDIAYTDLSVQPSLTGISVKASDLSYISEETTFSAEEISIEVDFINTLITKKFYLNESIIKNGNVNFFGQSEQQSNTLNYFVEDAKFSNFSFENLRFANLQLNNIISGNGFVGFSFSSLNLILPGNLQEINNLYGKGIFLDRQLKLLINSSLGQINIKGFDRFQFPELEGFIVLDFIEKFNIPESYLLSKTSNESLYASFVFNDYFKISLNQQAGSERLISTLPQTLKETTDFLKSADFRSKTIHLLLSYMSLDGQNIFDSVAYLDDVTINLNNLDLSTSKAKSYINSNLFSLFSEEINEENLSLSKVNISKKHSNERFQFHFDLYGSSFWSEYSDQKIYDPYWQFTSSEANSLFSVGGKKTIFRQNDYVFGFDLPEEILISGKGIKFNPSQINSNFFQVNKDKGSEFFLNLQDTRIENININAALKQNDLTPEGLTFKSLDFSLNNGFYDLGSGDLSMGGLLNITGTNVIYTENTFTPGILGVLSLIDIRSNILDLLSLDFEKLNTENILVDNLEANLFIDSDNFIYINNINLGFGSAEANISGTVSTEAEYLDTYDLNLVFDTNLSQNIPWYFALIGNIPAAAGAAVLSNLIEQDNNKLFSTRYQIKGNIEDLKVIPKQ
mgnify:CR=1 FL=1